MPTSKLRTNQITGNTKWSLLQDWIKIRFTDQCNHYKTPVFLCLSTLVYKVLQADVHMHVFISLNLISLRQSVWNKTRRHLVSNSGLSMCVEEFESKWTCWSHPLTFGSIKIQTLANALLKWSQCLLYNNNAKIILRQNFIYILKGKFRFKWVNLTCKVKNYRSNLVK